MTSTIRQPWVDFKHPANEGVLKSLKSCRPELSDEDAETSPESIGRDVLGLGTHPEVIARLWAEISADLPEDCRWVVYQRPILCHPGTGIIFGWASGTPTYSLRLPNPERAEAVLAGAKTHWTYNDAWRRDLSPEHNSVLNLADWGREWVFGNWVSDERRWCLAAYEAASRYP